MKVASSLLAVGLCVSVARAQVVLVPAAPVVAPARPIWVPLSPAVAAIEPVPRVSRYYSPALSTATTQQPSSQQPQTYVPQPTGPAFYVAAPSPPVVYLPLSPSIRMYVPAASATRRVQIERYYFHESAGPDASPPVNSTQAKKRGLPTDEANASFPNGTVLIREYYYIAQTPASEAPAEHEAPKSPEKLRIPEPSGASESTTKDAPPAKSAPSASTEAPPAKADGAQGENKAGESKAPAKKSS